MNYMKNLGISILISLGMIIILTTLMTLFSYFDIFGNFFVSAMKIIIPILSFFIGGISLGKKSNQKGWLEGIKLGLILIIIILIFNYLALDWNFNLKNTLYYLILMIGSIFGSMIGISRNKKEKN